MRALSNILGTAIGIVFITAVLIAFANYFNSVNSTTMRLLHAEKENLYLRPYINSSGTYVFIENPGPTEPVTIRYIILKNTSNGDIVSIHTLWKRLEVGESIDMRLLNTTSKTTDLVIIVVTDNGAVFYKELANDPNNQENPSTNTNTWYVNPEIGWAFNKSIVVENGSIIYYLISYLIGDPTWNNNVNGLDYRDYIDNYVLLRFYDLDNGGKRIDFIKVYAYKRPDGYYQCNFSFVYNDGTEKFLDSIVTGGGYKYKYVTINIEGRSLKIVDHQYFNISYKVDAGTITSIYIGFGVSTATSGYIDIWLDYGGGTGYKAYIDQYFKVDANDLLYLYLNRTGRNYYLNTGESTGWIYRGKVNFGDYRVSYYTIKLRTPYYFNFTKTGSAWTKEIFWVASPDPSYNVTINVPYISYDLYILNTSGDALSKYIRPSDQEIYLSYQNYLFPGENNLAVKCRVPEIYKIIIYQPNPTMPSYLIFIGWIDPGNVINIFNGGDPLLIKYGLLIPNSNISFKYQSIVFKDGKFLGNYNANKTIDLDYGVYAIIPLQGPYRGNIVYLWISDWKLINS